MATLTSTPLNQYVHACESLLNPYEDLTIQEYVPGVSGYVISLRTNLYIHRKHTRKDLFIPHSVYQATSITVLPARLFMEEWIKNARKAALKLINKGKYQSEALISGKWQPVTRHYNQWTFYDRKRNITFGEVKGVVGESPTHSKESHTKSIGEAK